MVRLFFFFGGGGGKGAGGNKYASYGANMGKGAVNGGQKGFPDEDAPPLDITPSAAILKNINSQVALLKHP